MTSPAGVSCKFLEWFIMYIHDVHDVHYAAEHVRYVFCLGCMIIIEVLRVVSQAMIACFKLSGDTQPCPDGGVQVAAVSCVWAGRFCVNNADMGRGRHDFAPQLEDAGHMSEVDLSCNP